MEGREEKAQLGELYTDASRRMCLGSEDQRRKERNAMRILRSEGQEQKVWLGEPSTDAKEGWHGEEVEGPRLTFLVAKLLL